MGMRLSIEAFLKNIRTTLYLTFLGKKNFDYTKRGDNL